MSVASRGEDQDIAMISHEVFGEPDIILRDRNVNQVLSKDRVQCLSYLLQISVASVLRVDELDEERYHAIEEGERLVNEVSNEVVLYPWPGIVCIRMNRQVPPRRSKIQ